MDEPLHVTSAVEWWRTGNILYPEQPPIARAFFAIWPQLSGASYSLTAGISEAGNDIFHTGGNYWRNLTLIRAGTLPFFFLAGLTMMAWARRYFDDRVMLASVLLFTSLPPILGHSALATVDLACAATCLLALYRYQRFLDAPGWPNGVLLLLATTLAFACKFSSLPFLFAAGALLSLLRFDAVRAILGALPAGRAVGLLALSAVSSTLLIWATYGFAIVPIGDSPSAALWIEKLKFTDAATIQAFLQKPLPLSQFIRGIAAVASHNQQGHSSYLLGVCATKGWWYFFPVVVLFKTPLGLLCLYAAAGWIALRNRRSQPQAVAAFLLPVVLIASCMTSSINLGVRHMLVVYPFLALAGGLALVRAWSGGQSWVPRAFSAAAVLWVLAAGISAHPSYIGYFNELAGSQPERILAESDLDWGQDLAVLARRLQERHVPTVSIAYFGSARLASAGLPPFTQLDPVQPATGYVAVSLRMLTIEKCRTGAFGWLAPATPIERIGNSMLLYYLPGKTALRVQ